MPCALPAGEESRFICLHGKPLALSLGFQLPVSCSQPFVQQCVFFLQNFNSVEKLLVPRYSSNTRHTASAIAFPSPVHQPSSPWDSLVTGSRLPVLQPPPGIGSSLPAGWRVARLLNLRLLSWTPPGTNFEGWILWQADSGAGFSAQDGY